MSFLFLLFSIPLLSSLVCFAFPKIPGKSFKWFAFLLSLFPLLILGINYSSWIGSELKYEWLPIVSVEFYLKLDALSLVFIFLVALVVPFSIVAVNSEHLLFPNSFYGLVLLVQGFLIVFFAARDLAVFVIFFEGMLIPIYFLISFWGGPLRQRAALKFLIYMIAGSAFMVAGVLALYFAGDFTFDLDKLKTISESLLYSKWLFAIFLLAFAVKTPLFPFHAWLPDAYCQAPTTGTILLSALLSKAGIYGILRIGMELFPTYMKEWNPSLLGFAIAGVLYGGLAAWFQPDFKRLIAYSSLSHVNFILAGIFVWSQTANEGAILQALNHGISITALFLVSGWLEERLGSTEFPPNGGLAQFMPHLCWLTLIFVLSTVALPGTNNFVGELLILFGIFGDSPWLAATIGLTVILSVIYMLRLMQRIYFGPPGFFEKSWIDISFKELALAIPLVFLIFWIGIYPSPFLNFIRPAAEKTVTIALAKEIS